MAKVQWSTAMKRYILLIFTLLLLAGCSTVTVNQDYRPGTTYSGYGTYRLVESQAAESSDIRVTNPLLKERFEEALDYELRLKGIVPSESAQLEVSYNYSIRTLVESDPFDTHVGFGYGTYGRRGGIGIGTGTSVRQYDQGTLVIDFIDTTTGQLVWRGTGSDRLYNQLTPDETTTKVNNLVKKIMEQYPPTRN